MGQSRDWSVTLLGFEVHVSLYLRLLCFFHFSLPCFPSHSFVLSFVSVRLVGALRVVFSIHHPS